MVGQAVGVLKDLTEVFRELLRAGRVQVKAVVIGVSVEIYSRLIQLVQEIDIEQPMLIRVIHDLSVPLIVPHRINTRGLHEDELDAVLLAQLHHHVQIFIAGRGKLVISERRLGRISGHRPDVHTHQISLVKGFLRVKHVTPVLRADLTPSGVVAQQRKDV